ncbi:MAG: M20/M25/M40 family metallo-hydrolase, partial [Verrucomicrobiota bacterium]
GHVVGGRPLEPDGDVGTGEPRRRGRAAAADLLLRGADSQGVLGGGVQVRAYDPTAIMSPRLVDLALDVAADAGVPVQLAVRRTGGTDARAFQAFGQGVPVIVLGVPARGIHTHQSVIDAADLRDCVTLAVALARRLGPGAVAGLTKFL